MGHKLDDYQKTIKNFIKKHKLPVTLGLNLPVKRSKKLNTIKSFGIGDYGITQAIEDHLIDFGPHTQGIKFVKMTGEYRLRQGDYRILFSVEKDTIKIKNIKNRKDVYR